MYGFWSRRPAIENEIRRPHWGQQTVRLYRVPPMPTSPLPPTRKQSQWVLVAPLATQNRYLTFLASIVASFYVPFSS